MKAIVWFVYVWIFFSGLIYLDLQSLTGELVYVLVFAIVSVPIYFLIEPKRLT